MSDQRRFQSIKSRYDIEISRWSFPRRRRLRFVTGLCGVLSLLACVPLLLSDHRAFQSRPVSRPHQLFEKNCRACHDQPWRTATRFASFDNSIHTVSDQACRHCHGESNLDHLQFATVDPHANNSTDSPPEKLTALFDKVACAGCHQEHRGKPRLADVSDRHCTNCHLKVEDADPSSPFLLNMTSFANHPEFAPIRTSSSDVSKSQRHPSIQRVDFENGQPRDNVAFKFSHHRHLDPELRAGGPRTEALDCQDCHVPATGGAYFKPIAFESHCKRCHQLGVKATGELPHVSPEIIHGLLLERLSTQKQDAIVPPADRIGGPTKRPTSQPATTPATTTPSTITPKTDRWSELASSLKELETQLFGPKPNSKDSAPPAAMSHMQFACSKCHVTEKTNGERLTWKVVPPRIPDRWFPSSHFDHRAHSAIACVDCHTRSGKPATDQTREQFYPTLTDDLKDSSSIYASTTSRDILLPGIRNCQACHGKSDWSGGVAAARADCFMCHDYHHPLEGVPTKSPLEQYLEFQAAEASPKASENSAAFQQITNFLKNSLPSK